MNNAMLEFYAAHSNFTNPGKYASLLEALPSDIPGLCTAIQGLIVHYRAEGIKFAPEREAEIDTRWMGGILAKIQARSPAPLTVPRAKEERFVGCCRDFTLLFVAVMRQKGVPARSRVGFAPYLSPSFNHDHVVAEYWNGERWVRVDPEMPSESFGFDVQDIPSGVFLSAAEVWRGYRQGRLEPDSFGVAPQLPYKGGWFIRNYVIKELAHLCKHELLLWDEWGSMSDKLEGHLGQIDQVAQLLLEGDGAFEKWLVALQDPALRIPAEVVCYSPTGNIRLVRLEPAPAI